MADSQKGPLESRASGIGALDQTRGQRLMKQLQQLIYRFTLKVKLVLCTFLMPLYSKLTPAKSQTQTFFIDGEYGAAI